MTMSTEPNRIRGLYGITPELADTTELIRRVHLALQGGVSLLQYRAKKLSHGLRQTQIQALRILCDEFSVPLILNDGLEAAWMSWVDGVHAGKEDASPSSWRDLAQQRLLGVSCYADIERAQAVEHAGGAYVAFGSFYPSSTKPDAPRVSLAVLEEARSRLHIPIVAIGGMTPERAVVMYRHGANAVAVSSDLFEASDITARARAYLSSWQIAGMS
ncbi:MAG: thiamine phosphate synthase [Ferrovum sp.]|nr:thiamine phosphate synthase [Ferrovum sp.]NDU87982.1 thiamine phosphate synthase [Ferrovum sp.]